MSKGFPMKKIFLIPLAFVVACQVACQGSVAEQFESNKDNNGVVGGVEVAKEDPLFRTVLLMRRLFNRKETVEGDTIRTSFSTFRCTASALSRRIILTAAHCVDITAEIHRIELKDAKGAPDYYKATKVVAHPEYATNPKADLALLFLEKDLPENIITVSLPTESLAEGFTTITAAGYGATSGLASGSAGPSVLRTTQLNILNYNAAEMTFNVDQSKGSGICMGDSGGPALVSVKDKVIVAGVTLGVEFPIIKKEDPAIDPCGFIGQYVTVEHFLKWITETMTSFEAPVEATTSPTANAE